MKIDRRLIEKYNKPGPRYTSYPTAPNFKVITDRDTVREQIGAELAQSAEISLYFHIPFCDTLCYFCGCNMLVTHNKERVENYLDQLCNEIELQAQRVKGSVKQVHFGGGTPTHLTPKQLDRLLGKIHSAFSVAADAEISCEIDPRELTYDHLAALKNGGVSRLSLGVQDFTEKVQVAVNRVQPYELIAEVVKWIRELGFIGFNLDLIYGLPHQTEITFAETIEKVLTFSPDRITTFSYAHVPWLKKHMSLISEADLPSPDVKLSLFINSIETLTENGYVFIGMDHFAKADDDLSKAMKAGTMYRNFQGYSTQKNLDLMAFGISGIGQTDNLFYQNFKTEQPYQADIELQTLPIEKAYFLTDEDKLRRYIIQQLMCEFKLRGDDIAEKFDLDFSAYFVNELLALEEFVSDGLLTKAGNTYTVSDTGRLLIRNIAMVFDTFIRDSQTKFSKTI